MTDQTDDPDMAQVWLDGYMAGLDYARSTRLRPPANPYQPPHPDAERVRPEETL